MREVVVSGRRLPLPPALVRRVVRGVLDGERRPALVSVTFLGRDAMRRLNSEHKGRDEPTDVLAFAMTDGAGRTVGDVYICAWVAAREAKTPRRAAARGVDPPGDPRDAARARSYPSRRGRAHPILDVAPPGALRRSAGVIAFLQLFLAPLVAAALTLWAAWLALAAESDAEPSPRARR